MRLKARIIVLAAVLAGTAANAALFQVAPVLVDVEPGQASAVVKLSNHSDAPISLQVRTFRWTQSGGKDELAPTNDLVASPPIVQIPAGAEHIVRVVRLGRTPPAREEAYRLWIDELPTRGADAGQIRMLVRQSIPVFFETPRAAAGEVHWSLSHSAQGWQLIGENPGSLRVRISDLRLAEGDGQIIYRQPGLVGYVLAGSTMSWPVAIKGSPTGSVTVSASSPSGPISARIVPTSS